MKRFDYNLIVIGAGAGGLITSYIGAAIQAKVALIEEHKMGGDCLNTGCVPSKALIRSAKAAKAMQRHADFGLENVQYTVNFAKVMEGVQEAIRKIEPHDSAEHYQKLGVDCLSGRAKLLSPHEVSVGGKPLSARDIVIATGARPSIPPIPGLADFSPLHSENLWELQELPQRLLVVGGGPVGCEMAQAFARLGSQVHLMDQLPQLLPKEDPDMLQPVLDAFQEDGIEVSTRVKIVQFEKMENLEKAGRVVYEKGGQTQSYEFDQVLMATGRKANTDNLGLQELGVVLSTDGTIQVDDYMRTNIPSLYACGDVAGPYQLTHVAAHQAWYCAINALARPIKQFKVDYSVIPWCTYTDPELARVGLSEAEAQAQNIPFEVTTYGLEELDRAITDREDWGMVKVLTSPGRDTILGAAICGAHAGDVLAEFVLAMKHGLGLNKILSTIHTYPTFSESPKYVAGAWKQSHLSAWGLRLAEYFHAWRRSQRV